MRFSPHWTFGIMLMALTAHADSPASRGSCNGPQLKLDSYLKARKPWVAAVNTANKRLSEYGEVDRCAVLDIQWSGSEAIVRASVPDGRSAMRRANNPEALTSTVLALLALPNAPLALAAADTTRTQQNAASASNSSAASGASRTSEATQRNAHRANDDEKVAMADLPIPSMDLHEVAADTPSDETPGGGHRPFPQRPHAEIGAFTSAARITGSDRFLGGIGAGALAQYVTDGWIVAASGRAEKLYNLNDERDGRLQSEAVITVGPAVGRRLTTGKAWIDVMVPIEFTFESSTVQPSVSKPRAVDGTARTDLRVGATLRASWGLGTSRYRLFGAFDGDVSPSRLFDPPQETEANGTIVERRPPRFSLGLSIGVLWGAL